MSGIKSAVHAIGHASATWAQPLSDCVIAVELITAARTHDIRWFERSQSVIAPQSGYFSLIAFGIVVRNSSPHRSSSMQLDRLTVLQYTTGENYGV
jgi:hypothetical protein